MCTLVPRVASRCSVFCSLTVPWRRFRKRGYLPLAQRRRRVLGAASRLRRALYAGAWKFPIARRSQRVLGGIVGAFSASGKGWESLRPKRRKEETVWTAPKRVSNVELCYGPTKLMMTMRRAPSKKFWRSQLKAGKITEEDCAFMCASDGDQFEMAGRSLVDRWAKSLGHLHRLEVEIPDSLSADMAAAGVKPSPEDLALFWATFTELCKRVLAIFEKCGLAESGLMSGRLRCKAHVGTQPGAGSAAPPAREGDQASDGSASRRDPKKRRR
jgi:hypothetical protein